MHISLKIFLFILFVLSVSACSQTPTSSPNSSSYAAQKSSHTPYPPTTTYLSTGKASYYADKYHGRKTASGERFNQRANNAAHKKLPFGTWVKVTNVNNGKSVRVRINDRGPFVRGRIIDLSKSAFNSIANPRLGVVDVVVEVIR